MVRKLSLLWIGFTLFSILLGSRRALAVERIRILRQDPNSIAWRIDEPEVRRFRSNYPVITFRPGDEVRVIAGGCVQTGGSGLTWKRYVNPSGRSSDRLYHGRIWIPGATAGLVRISSVVGQPLLVNKFPRYYDGSSLFLQLGYEDDDYSDNGYWGHDDGTGGQCRYDRDGGPAWIEITITHRPTVGPPGPSPAPRAPLDLWWDTVDDNFLPYNPMWWYQSTHQGAPPNARALCENFRNPNDSLPMGRDPRCTLWDPDVDERSTFALCLPNPSEVAGHINWAPATYKGKICFHDFSGPFPQDNDYNMALTVMDRRGLTTGNDWTCAGQTALALEFDSRETIDRFDGFGLWWETFHRTVDRSQDAARAMVNGLDAITIGLMGLDNQHGGQTELHPVYGLAIQVDGNNPSHEKWAFFARNWGNEGGCSQAGYTHGLALKGNKMSFFFQNPEDAVLTANSGLSRFRADGTTPQYDMRVVGDGIILTITLPEPVNGSFSGRLGIVFGEVYLNKEPAAAAVWSGPGTRQIAFRTLRQALDAAHDGDTVFIRPGSYPDTLTITKRVTLTRWGTGGTVIIGSR